MYLVRDCSLLPKYHQYHDLYLSLNWKDVETFLNTYCKNRFIYITDEVVKQVPSNSETVQTLPIYNLKFNDWHTNINANLIKRGSRYSLHLNEDLRVVDILNCVPDKHWLGNKNDVNSLRVDELYCSDGFNIYRFMQPVKVIKSGSLIIVFKVEFGNIKDI